VRLGAPTLLNGIRCLSRRSAATRRHVSTLQTVGVDTRLTLGHAFRASAARVYAPRNLEPKLYRNRPIGIVVMDLVSFGLAQVAIPCPFIVTRRSLLAVYRAQK